MLNASVVRGEAARGDTILCVLRDISALAEARQALQEINRQLEQRIERRTSELDRSKRGRHRTAEELAAFLAEGTRLIARRRATSRGTDDIELLTVLDEVEQLLRRIDPSDAAPTRDPPSQKPGGVPGR